MNEQPIIIIPASGERIIIEKNELCEAVTRKAKQVQALVTIASDKFFQTYSGEILENYLHAIRDLADQNVALTEHAFGKQGDELVFPVLNESE